MGARKLYNGGTRMGVPRTRVESPKKIAAEVRKAWRIHKQDGSYIDLELCRATRINMNMGILHMDRTKDGNFRLTWSKDIVEEFGDVKSIEIIRERK